MIEKVESKLDGFFECFFVHLYICDRVMEILMFNGVLNGV